MPPAMTATATIVAETAHPARRSGRAFAAMVAGNICLSFGPWLVRLAGVAPEVSAFWRMTIAAPILFLIVKATRQALPPLSRPIILVLIGAGLFFAADLAAWHVGILHTRMANATLFGNATSFFFPIYGFLIARAWPTRRQGIAMGIALAGVLLLAGRSYELSAQHLFGDVMCIVAALTYTGYLVVLQRTRETTASMPLIAMVTAATIPPLGLFAWWMGHPMLPHDWTPLVLLAIGSQCLGQGLILFSLGQLPPVIVGLGLMIQPIVGSSIGWIFYGERLTAPDFIGALMIGTALVLVRGRA